MASGQVESTSQKLKPAPDRRWWQVGQKPTQNKWMMICTRSNVRDRAGSDGLGGRGFLYNPIWENGLRKPWEWREDSTPSFDAATFEMASEAVVLPATIRRPASLEQPFPIFDGLYSTMGFFFFFFLNKVFSFFPFLGFQMWSYVNIPQYFWCILFI